jgi:hypothetical protein
MIAEGLQGRRPSMLSTGEISLQAGGGVMRRFAITVGLWITFGAGLVVTTVRPASAGYNIGVKYVHLDSAPACCPEEGSALPPGVRRRDHVLGPAHQHHLRPPDRNRCWLPLHRLRRGGGVSSTTVPISLELSAGCRSGHRIHEAHLSQGESWDEGTGIVPVEAFSWSHSIDVDATKSFSTRLVADADIDHIERNHSQRDDWELFGTGSDLTSRGEYLVERAVEEGAEEEAARLQTRSDVVFVVRRRPRRPRANRPLGILEQPDDEQRSTDDQRRLR